MSAETGIKFDCLDVTSRAGDYLDKKTPPEIRQAIVEHLSQCDACAKTLHYSQAIHGMFEYLGAARRDELPAAPEEPHAPAARSALALGNLPWWFVSAALHVLIIALASLVSLAFENSVDYDRVIMITELQPRAVAAESAPPEKSKADLLDALNAEPTAPIDRNSRESSDIAVPPDILARAELSDHFETINPDRPDTHSAFGTPDSRSFHSFQGDDQAAGGGGMNGLGMEDLIGVGGGASRGTGGGFGGGDGTGIGTGVGRGSGSFGQRNGGGRRLLLKANCGSQKTENAVELSLDWLARHQEADGSWNGAKNGSSGICATGVDPGLTGLAVLAFLGAGHSEKIGKYKENVRKAVAWIIAQQRKDGAIGRDPRWTTHHTFFAYHHAICGMALAEAAGMARIPETKEAAQRAIDFSVEVFQSGAGSERGGWRYVEKPDVCDMSVSGWFIMQLKSAKIAGLKVDPLAFEGALNFMKTREEDPARIQKEDPVYDNGRHRYGYTERTPNVNTTAIGLLCQLFCGTPPDECRGAAMWLLRTNPPAWNSRLGLSTTGTWPMYYTYYTTLTMFQMGGDQWKNWNELMKKMLLENQRKDGDAKGSWDPLAGSLEQFGGRVFTTALGCLSLEVYYRYVRLNN